MGSYPGVVISRTNFCGLFARAWNESVTTSNILSRFRACGIHPLNPGAVPSEAYLTNSMYTVQQIISQDVSSQTSSEYNIYI